MLDPVIFEAFARCYEPPHWVIEDFLKTGSRPLQEALRSALDAVPDSDVRLADREVTAQAMTRFCADDADERIRLYRVSESIWKYIEKARISELLPTPREIGRPYDHPALDGIDVDSEGLVPLSAFRIEGDSLLIGDYAFFVMPPVPGSNSAYWLLQELQRHELTDKARVRLNPFLHGPAKQLRGRDYRATIWGRSLDWDRISQLRVPEHGQWQPGKLSTPSMQTDFTWNPHDQEIDFLCEELPTMDEVDFRGARYLHAVYDKQVNQITHLDGAIRVYNSDELSARKNKHVRNAGKVGKRAKIFRTDSSVSPEVLSSIAVAFFFWNYDVARYFGEPVPEYF